ncbi:uncharacterized protein LOC125523232 [Triticum urartu]|nr:uncharacterized protein LOC125523232 [Triticum urartu]
MESSQSNCSSTLMAGSDRAKAQMMHCSASDDGLDHILSYMGRSSTASCRQETKPTNPSSSALDHLINSACHSGSSTLYDKFMKLPPLEHVVPSGILPPPAEYGGDWDDLDRLAEYELNGLSDAATTKTTNGMSYVVDELGGATAYSGGGTLHAYSVTGAGDGDLWSLARSASSLQADLRMTCFNAVGC